MYNLKLLKGKFKGQHIDIYRVIVVSDNDNPITEIGFEPIVEGYGTSSKDAIDNFIHANKYNVLKKLFTEENNAIQDGKAQK